MHPQQVHWEMRKCKDTDAQVICTMFFVSGIITLLQTVFGDRLPIIQVGSLAFLAQLHVSRISAHTLRLFQKHVQRQGNGGRETGA